MLSMSPGPRASMGLALVLVALTACVSTRPKAPLRIVVMDPLAAPLACDCVAGYAQRRYERLGDFLAQRLGRPVVVSWSEALADPRARLDDGVDLVIGKLSVVAHDARQVGLRIRTVAMLSGNDGAITQTGLFVVRGDDPAKTIEDLKGRRLCFGPAEADEKRAAPLATLEAFNLPVPEPLLAKPSCSATAMAVIEKEAEAGVVSSYAKPLLEGCGAIQKGEVRIVGKTDPVPFIAVVATDRVDAAAERAIVEALLAVRDDKALLAALESRDGFVPLPALGTASWADWRGPNRDAVSPLVPKTLPKTRRLLWSHVCTGPGMAGLAVADGRVVAADKSLDDARDIWRCLDADTGRQLWTLAYPAAGEMDFTNSPRANPVVHDGLVYLLGAFGHLHCLRLDTGKIVWKTHLRQDFGAQLPNWGYAPTPLIVGDKLIVTPGAKDASIVALDRRTGKLIWKTAGIPPGYSSFIVTTLGGVRQLVGYDATSLGGWDPDTGKRLWTLHPPEKGDYNVPTPIAVDGKLLVTTENNGPRLYAFDARGHIVPKPVAANEDLSPDTATPVVVGDLVYGSDETLLCLDLRSGLKTCWEDARGAFSAYSTLIAGADRVLVVTQGGELWLLRPSRTGCEVVSKLALFDDVPQTERDVWSHPALVANRLYIRNLLGVYCFLLD